MTDKEIIQELLKLCESAIYRLGRNKISNTYGAYLSHIRKLNKLKKQFGYEPSVNGTILDLDYAEMEKRFAGIPSGEKFVCSFPRNMGKTAATLKMLEAAGLKPIVYRKGKVDSTGIFIEEKDDVK